MIEDHIARLRKLCEGATPLRVATNDELVTIEIVGEGVAICLSPASAAQLAMTISAAVYSIMKEGGE